MKTLLNTTVKSSLAAIILLAALFTFNTAAAFAAGAANHVFKTPIKKVVVTGNTRVLIVQSSIEMVKMDELDLDKVSVKQIGGTLTVHSAEINPITVYVYVNDIYRIQASGDASVRISGKFTVKNLQVMLSDHASARIRAYTESLYTTVSDHAKLQLLGNSNTHDYKMAGLAKMDTNKFASLKSQDITTPEDITASLKKIQLATIKK